MSTEFFHAIANGRRCRCTIKSLRAVDVIISGESELRSHIDGFYRALFGSSEPGLAQILATAWGGVGMVTPEDNLRLIEPFMLEEVMSNLEGMKSNTAPGPDGSPVTFYSKFWGTVGSQFFRLVDGFTRGYIDIKRLNYGVLALLPKVKGTENIRQFRPITLINVFSCSQRGLRIGLLPWLIK